MVVEKRVLIKVVFPSPDSPATITVKAAPRFATILWLSFCQEGLVLERIDGIPLVWELLMLLAVSFKITIGLYIHWRCQLGSRVPPFCVDLRARRALKGVAISKAVWSISMVSDAIGAMRSGMMDGNVEKSQRAGCLLSTSCGRKLALTKCSRGLQTDSSVRAREHVGSIGSALHRLHG